MRHFSRLVPILTLLAVIIVPALATATEPDADHGKSTVVIRGDDGEEITVSLSDGSLTVISREDGKTTTRIVDLDTVGLLAADAVDEAMLGMAGVFAELQEMQLQCRLGQDNRLNLSYNDTEFELDLDQVMAQVASAVQLGLQEIDASEWASSRDRWETVSDDEMRDELESLKTEMEALRAELRNLQQENR